MDILGVLRRDVMTFITKKGLYYTPTRMVELLARPHLKSYKVRYIDLDDGLMDDPWDRVFYLNFLADDFENRTVWDEAFKYIWKKAGKL